MSMGKAIVSTTVGAEGVNLSANENIIYADDADSFANGIIALLKNKETTASFGQSVRNIATSTYDWDIIANKLLTSYNTIITTNT